MALVVNEKRSIPDAAAALGMPANALNVWVNQWRNAKGAFLPDEQRDLAARVRELEAENRRLKLERDIL